MNKSTKSAGLFGGKVIIKDSLPSTNTWSLLHSKELNNGDIIAAIEQTQGRGRFNRKWFSTAKKCLTFSVILKSGFIDKDKTQYISMAAALAIRHTLQEYGVKSFCKWPNDVIAGEGKISGILVETDSSSDDIILGIGINVNMSESELEVPLIKQIATSMLVQKHVRYAPFTVLQKLIPHLEKTLLILRNNGFNRLLNEWRKNDALSGCNIRLKTERRSITGSYAGIDQDGKLLIKDRKGNILSFYSGDVSLI